MNKKTKSYKRRMQDVNVGIFFNSGTRNPRTRKERVQIIVSGTFMRPGSALGPLSPHVLPDMGPPEALLYRTIQC